MKMTEERIAELNTMCMGIARANVYKFDDKTVDQLTEDLLWKLWKEQEKSEKLIDLPLCAVICYKEVVNLQRKGMNVTKHEVSKATMETSSREESENSADQNNEASRTSKSSEWTQGTYEFNNSVESKIMIENLLNLFEKGSKEDMFLRFWATSVGILENEFGPECQKFNESELAWVLGYAGTASGGFKRFRNKMRDFVAEYFGIDR